MKIAKFKDYLYRNKIIVTYGTLEEVRKWFDNKGIELVFDAEWGAFAGRLPTGEVHLHFTQYGFSVIVHETNHATFEVMERAGIKLSHSTQEAFAYYQDWLAGKCLDCMEKWTKTTIGQKQPVNKSYSYKITKFNKNGEVICK